MEKQVFGSLALALLPVRVWGGWSACSPVLCPEECSSSLACPSPSNLRNFLAAGRCGIQVAPSLEGKAEFVAAPESGSVVPTHTLPAAPAAACPRHPPGGPMPVKKKKKSVSRNPGLSHLSPGAALPARRGHHGEGGGTVEMGPGDGWGQRPGPAPRCGAVHPLTHTHTLELHTHRRGRGRRICLQNGEWSGGPPLTRTHTALPSQHILCTLIPLIWASTLLQAPTFPSAPAYSHTPYRCRSGSSWHLGPWATKAALGLGQEPRPQGPEVNLPRFHIRF